LPPGVAFVIGKAINCNPPPAGFHLNSATNLEIGYFSTQKKFE